MPIQEPILLVDLRGQYLSIKNEIDEAVARVLDSGWYILGKEVAAFEEEFAGYCALGDGERDHRDHIDCIGVNSGTDALHLALRACDIGPGDEVITVAHTAVATAAAISLTGATPVFVDIDPAIYTMNPASLEAAMTPATKAIVPVHLYGQPADMSAILAIAARAGVRVVEDCAQSHGARYDGRMTGTMGDLGCFSFYPTKNLGALGDGGAVISRNPELAHRVRLLREYGWTPAARYVSQVQGSNSRLDEMQAAILRVKLRHLDEWNAARRELADGYGALLPEGVVKPVQRMGCDHVYHLYVVSVPNRDAVRIQLQAAKIGTGIHYPVPIHLQPAYRNGKMVAHDLSQTERLATEIVSLPMHPLMTYEQVQRTADALAAALQM